MDRRSTDVVSRPRVVDLFRLAIESPVTLVNAPTGYGKTFAVRQFLEVDEHPHAYVTFEPQDDRNTGWHKLLVEMERANIAPGLGTITQLFGDPASIDLGRLATLDEAERLSRTAVVVLDGIDEVREAAAIEEFAFFANRLPPTVRLVALTRRQLGLPVARWRAQSRLAEIGADDLRFDYDETAAVLHSTAADPPLDIDVRALTDRVEGWPLGVATVARWQAEGRPAGDPADVEAIVEPILRPLPDDVQEFLLQTSVLSRFDAELCRAVTDREDAGRLLDYVEEANLFLVSLADAPGWYRYRRFFAELLRRELERRHPGAAIQLHQRAGQWWKAHGNVEGAMRHLVASGRDEDALAMVSEEIYRPRIEGFVGVDWEKVFSPQWIADDPARMIQFATLLGRSGAIENAKVWMDRADAAIAATPLDDPRRVLMLAVHSLWHGLHLDAQVAVDYGFRALALGEEVLSPEMRERLYSTLPSSLILLGQVDDAERFALELDRITHSGVVHDLLVPSMRARHALVRGELRRAEELARPALRIAEATELAWHPVVRNARLALAGVLAERGALDAAAADLAVATNGTDVLGWTALSADARLAAARVLLARDGPASALALLDDVRESLRRTPTGPELVAVLDGEEARVRIAASELDWADVLVAGLPDGLERTLLSARIAIERGELSAATGLLEAAEPVWLRERITVHLLAARVAGNAGQAAERDRSLLEAARLGSREGFVTVFLDEAPKLVRRLRNLVPADPSLRGLGDAFSALKADSADGMTVPLSSREIEVLRYLRSSLTKPEIAAQMGISTNTLKSHVRVLYRKLGVRSRPEAVSVARKTGLL